MDQTWRARVIAFLVKNQMKDRFPIEEDIDVLDHIKQELAVLGKGEVKSLVRLPVEYDIFPSSDPAFVKWVELLVLWENRHRVDELLVAGGSLREATLCYP